MKVEVLCQECDGVEMKGAPVHMRTPDGKTQSREFSCPGCMRLVTVVITKNEDE